MSNLAELMFVLFNVTFERFIVEVAVRNSSHREKSFQSYDKCLAVRLCSVHRSESEQPCHSREDQSRELSNSEPMLFPLFALVCFFLSIVHCHQGYEETINRYLRSLEPLPGFIDCSFTSNAINGPKRNQCNITAKKAAQIRIACVGDSITALGWPNEMQKDLNAKYPGKFSVINFGECGSTLQRNGNSPYIHRPAWPEVLNSNSDVIIIMLGTNDAKDHTNDGPPNWENSGFNSTGIESYSADYGYFVDVFGQYMPQAVIYAAIPPPNYKKGVYGMDAVVINNVYPFLIPHLNTKLNLPYPPIDIFDAMGGINLQHPEWFYDGCHPNVEGLKRLAAAMQKGLNL